MTVSIDIGQGRTVEPVENAVQGLAGYIERHPKPDNAYNRGNGVVGQACSGYVNVDPEFESSATWTLVQADPLTLSPSILCRACGNHGFIRDGQWVPA